MKTSLLSATMILLLAAPALAQNKGEIVTVLGAGAGTTHDEALKDAFTNAVQMAVGVVIDSETMINNDEIIKEQVLTYSNAYIETYKELSRSAEKGIVRVRIKANVRRNKLQEKLSAVTKTSTAVKGTDVFAKMVTTLKHETDAKKITRKLFEGFPGNVIRGDVVGQPRIIAKDGDVIRMGVTVQYQIDSKRYSQWMAMTRPHFEKLSAKTADLRWNPSGMKMRNYATDEYLLRIRKSKVGRDIKKGKRDRTGRLLKKDKSYFPYVPKSAGRQAWSYRSPKWPDVSMDNLFVIVDKVGHSRAKAYSLGDEAYTEAIAACTAVPELTVILRDRQGEEIDSSAHVGVNDTADLGGAKQNLHITPFVYSSDSYRLTPVFQRLYSFSNDVSLTSTPAKKKYATFVNELNMLGVIPYIVTANGSNACISPAFNIEYTFELSAEQVKQIAKVDVEVRSRNNMTDAK